MRHLAIGCVFRATGKKPCVDATMSGKLLSRFFDARFAADLSASGVWLLSRNLAGESKVRLRVKNAGCLKNVTVEPAKLREF
jgi:hypothetical protein